MLLYDGSLGSSSSGLLFVSRFSYASSASLHIKLQIKMILLLFLSSPLFHRRIMIMYEKSVRAIESLPFYCRCDLAGLSRDRDDAYYLSVESFFASARARVGRRPINLFTSELLSARRGRLNLSLSLSLSRSKASRDGLSIRSDGARRSRNVADWWIPDSSQVRSLLPVTSLIHPSFFKGARTGIV